MSLTIWFHKPLIRTKMGAAGMPKPGVCVNLTIQCPITYRPIPDNSWVTPDRGSMYPTPILLSEGVQSMWSSKDTSHEYTSTYSPSGRAPYSTCVVQQNNCTVLPEEWNVVEVSDTGQDRTEYIKWPRSPFGYFGNVASVAKRRPWQHQTLIEARTRIQA